jgi:hypothetical protein
VVCDIILKRDEQYGIDRKLVYQGEFHDKVRGAWVHFVSLGNDGKAGQYISMVSIKELQESKKQFTFKAKH